MPYLGRQYYEEAGSGLPVVLIHGHSLDRRMWEPVVEVLVAAGCRVIRPDLAGHGLSAPPPEASTPAGDLADLLNALSIERAVMVGLSLGGAVAINFALRYPERTAALVAVDSALFGYRFAEWAGPRAYAGLARSEGLEAARKAWLADSLFAPAMAGPAADQVRRIVADFSGWDWLQKAPSPVIAGEPLDADRLGAVQVPTLVLMGEKDLPDFHRIAERLAGEIPGAQLHLVPGVGHLLPVEAPETFLEQLLPFLDEVRGR